MSSKSVRAKSRGSTWLPLKSGDLIDVVAPGFAALDDEVEAGVRFLEGWGLRVRLPHDLFGADTIASNTDEKRLNHLEHALLAKDSKAVWCLRGGYGAIRLVPGLLKLKRPARAKLLVGLSDVTTLQLWLQQKWMWPSLQAPLVDRLARLIDPKLAELKKVVPVPGQIEELRRVVFGEATSVLFEGLRPHGGLMLLHGAKVAKKARFIDGVTTGGNLATWVSAVGTRLHPKTDGQIVFFEDIGERGYRVDRLLEQLVQAKVLTAKTKALVFGEFTGGQEPDGSERVSDVIERFAATWGQANNVPVFTGIPLGHGQNQRVLPIGTRARLDMVSGSLDVKAR